MIPAHEGLDAVDLAGAQLDLSLKVQDQLVFIEGGAQLLGEDSASSRVQTDECGLLTC